jgi:hypothetical protein
MLSRATARGYFCTCPDHTPTLLLGCSDELASRQRALRDSATDPGVKRLASPRVQRGPSADHRPPSSRAIAKKRYSLQLSLAMNHTVHNAKRQTSEY